MLKIKNRKQKADTSKDDELDLLRDEDVVSVEIRQTLRVLLTIYLLLHHVLSPNVSSHYVHPPGGWIYYFCFFRRPMSDVRRPMSGVTHGFRSFKGKVLELLSPNLVCRLIGSVACLGLLLAVVPLLLTE